jgi:hypothetical protein
LYSVIDECLEPKVKSKVGVSAVYFATEHADAQFFTA